MNINWNGVAPNDILDRFGLCVDVEGIRDPDERVLIAERDAAFKRGDHEFANEFAAADHNLARALAEAIAAVRNVRTTSAQARLISSICVEADVLGHRADVVIDRASRALAAYRRHATPSRGDIYDAATLALAPYAGWLYTVSAAGLGGWFLLEAHRLQRRVARMGDVGERVAAAQPADSKVTLTIGRNFPLAAALGNGRLALADPGAVPAGKYGKAALEALGVWSSVADKIAPTPDVRAALVLVARGETPLGIVYQTDAAADKAVKTVGTFPANTHPPIVYPIAITASSSHPDAQSYVAFLKSDAAKPAFEKQGFVRLP